MSSLFFRRRRGRRAAGPAVPPARRGSRPGRRRAQLDAVHAGDEAVAPSNRCERGIPPHRYGTQRSAGLATSSPRAAARGAPASTLHVARRTNPRTGSSPWQRFATGAPISVARRGGPAGAGRWWRSLRDRCWRSGNHTRAPALRRVARGGGAGYGGVGGCRDPAGYLSVGVSIARSLAFFEQPPPPERGPARHRGAVGRGFVYSSRLPAPPRLGPRAAS